MLNARTKCSAGRVERISRLAQVNPAELECLLWHSPPGVLDVSVSCQAGAGLDEPATPVQRPLAPCTLRRPAK